MCFPVIAVMYLSIQRQHAQNSTASYYMRSRPPVTRSLLLAVVLYSPVRLFHIDEVANKRALYQKYTRERRSHEQLDSNQLDRRCPHRLLQIS